MTMPSLSNRVQKEIDNISLNASNDEILLLSIASKNSRSITSSVESVQQLPANVPAGSIFFVESLSTNLIRTANGSWDSLDGGLKFGNTLWGWGRNTYGGLGDGTSFSDKSSPVQEITYSTNWSRVSGGLQHTAAIKTNGTLWTWGENPLGELGDGTTVNKSSPVQEITRSAKWIQVSAGTNTTAAIKSNGTLWAWGNNYYGQLGDNYRTNRSSPVQEITSSTNWQQISLGNQHTAAIKTNGTLWAWGYNSSGQLGDGTRTHRSSPKQEITSSTNWQQVSTGKDHTAAIKTDGTLWLWGENGFYQLGDGTTVDKSSPRQEITSSTNWLQVGGGENHSAAIKLNGTLWSWGYNVFGQLGDNTATAFQSSPVQEITSSTNWSQVDAGSSHTSAIKSDGTLWTWGRNIYGQLGDGTVTNRSSPKQEITKSIWTFVSASESTFGLKSY